MLLLLLLAVLNVLAAVPPLTKTCSTNNTHSTAI